VTHDQVEAITLGDRIAVLSDGVLQQAGAPQDVYDDPANVFVAGFIGSPPMNLLLASAGRGRVTLGNVELDGRAAPEGPVIVGIRPEGLRPVGHGHDGPVLELRVDVIEPLGDEVLAHGSVPGSGTEPVAGVGRSAEDASLLSEPAEGGRAAVTVRLPPEDRPVAGSTLRLAIVPTAIRLFDPATGLAIGSTVRSSAG